MATSIVGRPPVQYRAAIFQSFLTLTEKSAWLCFSKKPQFGTRPDPVHLVWTVSEIGGWKGFIAGHDAVRLVRTVKQTAPQRSKHPNEELLDKPTGVF